MFKDGHLYSVLFMFVCGSNSIVLPVCVQVIRSLKRAFQPAVTDVRVEFKVPGGYEIMQSPQNLPPVFNGEKLVVYGILKAKGSARDSSGKAVLRGMILGKKLEHSVSFQLVRIPGVAPKLASIHHLAGKALVKDWESEGQSKESVVKLSIESSVISSHTAFVVIDEENSEPISGAMKTWDIRASENVLCGALGVAGGPVLPVRLASKKNYLRRRCTSGARMSETPVWSTCNALSLPSPPGPALMGMRLPVPPPPAASIMGRSLEPMSSEPMSPPSRSEAPRSINIRAKSAAMSMSSSLRDAGPQVSMDYLPLLVSSQQANGSWILNAGLSRLLGKALAELEGACPVECRDDMAGVWATLLALCQLRHKYSSQQDEWELIAMKAESWLKRQPLPAGVTLSDLKQAAEKTLA